MRVCHATSVHPPFDVRIFHKECRTLVHAGHDVTLLAQAGWSERVVDKVRVVGLPRISERRQRARVWRHIVAEVRTRGPAIVHFHDPELLLVAPLLRPAKLIYDCHEPYSHTMLVRRWIPRPLRHPASRLVAFLEPTLVRWLDAIVVTADRHADRFVKQGRPVVVVHNYPVLSSFGFACGGDGRTILHVGVLSEGRGSTTMIEAMNLVVRRLPGATLLLVGAFDSPADEIEVRRQIVSYGLEETVQVVGQVPFSDLTEWFSRADVGLVPWQTERVLPQYIIPTKMFEYMACSLPIVASRRSAIRRFMEPLNCGLLVEPGDAQEFADAIVHLLTHPDEAKAMGARGRGAVERDYHWSSEGEKLLTLYCQLSQARL